MKHTITHDLEPALAHKATSKAFETYAERFTEYKAQAVWKNDSKAEISFSIKGKVMTGSVELRHHAIDLELDVPFIFRVFRKQAMGLIEGEINTWIAKAKAGELD